MKTDAQKVHAALEKLHKAATNAWEQGAYDESDTAEMLLYSEITDWCENLMWRMQADGLVSKEQS